MLRWLLVFGYRPTFDGGGDKWPYLHHMIITSLLLGQLITGATLFTKGNALEGLTILFLMIPTLVYNNIIFEKFNRPFQDAALLQSCRMYSGTDDPTAKTRSWLQREEYRRWLVDCHKASYLPTCLSGAETNLLTTEPAMVLVDGTTATNSGDKNKNESIRNLFKRQDGQKGGILRRHQFNINWIPLQCNAFHFDWNASHRILIALGLIFANHDLLFLSRYWNIRHGLFSGWENSEVQLFNYSGIYII